MYWATLSAAQGLAQNCALRANLKRLTPPDSARESTLDEEDRLLTTLALSILEGCALPPSLIPSEAA